MHPFMDLTESSDNQLYAKLVVISDRMKAVEIYGMNHSIIEQLEMQQISIEMELQERLLNSTKNKPPELDELGHEIIHKDTGTVWSMDGNLKV